MAKPCLYSIVGAGLAVSSHAALAATTEETMERVTMLMFYGSIVFAIAVLASVFFMRSRDKRADPLSRIFEQGEAVHSVAPGTPVAECVRLMTAKRIGALVVIEGEKLCGIFTERDALTRVLAAGLDPAAVKVSEVMSRDLFVVPGGTTVRAAMELITARRLRHLPIVDEGRLVAIVSSGDLTRWLIQDRAGDVRDLVGVAGG